MSNENKLKFFNLPTLTCRRFRGNMIEPHIILNNKYVQNMVSSLTLCNNSLIRATSLNYP